MGRAVVHRSQLPLTVRVFVHCRSQVATASYCACVCALSFIGHLHPDAQEALRDPCILLLVQLRHDQHAAAHPLQGCGGHAADTPGAASGPALRVEQPPATANGLDPGAVRVREP